MEHNYHKGCYHWDPKALVVWYKYNFLINQAQVGYESIITKSASLLILPTLRSKEYRYT